MNQMDYFVGGLWNFRCDECGAKRKSDVARHRWDGAIVCPRCWEPRHPQDFVRGVKDDQSIAWSRPSPPDAFIEQRTDVDLTVRVVPSESGSAGGTFTLGKLTPADL